MRRLWAYLITAFTALVLVCTTFTNVITQVSTNYEYETGTELAFRIGTEEDHELPSFQDGTALKDMAKVMEERLQLQGISKYTVATEGTDTIKVAFTGSNDDVEKVKTFLSFNGEFALSTDTDQYVLGEKFLTDEDAYYVDENNFPTIVLPINKDDPELKTVIEAVLDQQEQYANENTGAEGEEVKVAYLYLWCDYIEEEDTFNKTLETIDGNANEEYDPNVASKIIMSFAADNLYYDEDEDKLAASLNADADGDEVLTVSEVAQAFSNARYFVNLINSGTLEYDVEFIYQRAVDPLYEELIGAGTHLFINFTPTFIATLIAILVLTALLATFYRLGAIATGTTTLLSVFAGLGFIVLFSVEFNTAAIIGLALVAISSLISGVIHLNKLKEESYKGRSLKKANAEATKKSILPIVDVNVVTIIIGAAAYLLGGPILKGFAAATVLGGVASLLLNLSLLRGMLWLATNTTDLQGKYGVFGIEADKVPNIIAEEKQTYFGPYADKDLTKKKKPIGIITTLLFVASLVGGIVFGVLGNGNVYNNSGVRTGNSEIYFETSEKYTSLSSNYINDLANDIRIQLGETADPTKDTKLLTYIEDIEEYTHTIFEDKTEVTYTYFVVSLNNALSSEATAYYYDEDAATPTILYEGTINDTLLSAVGLDEPKATVAVKEVNYVEQDQPAIAPIALSTGVAILLVGLYLVLRYRLSRGIAATLLATATGTVTLGAFILTRIALPTYVNIALPVVVAFAFAIAILVLNKDRELVLEDKAKDNSPAHRAEIAVKANSHAFTPVIIVTVLAVYLAINFFGFGAAQTSSIYLVIIVGLLLSALIISTLLAPLASGLYNKLYKAEGAKPRKAKKTKKVVRNKSAEPEEATFIGIND